MLHTPKVFAVLKRLAKLPLQNSSSPFLGALIQIRHASHGTAGIANGPKDSPGKRLGAKKGADEYVVAGNIIFRQRGTKWFPGENCGIGRDHTIFARESGYVRFYRNPHLHSERRYIGIALEKHHTLPTPVGAPRRRRLNMIAVPRRDPEPLETIEPEIQEVTTPAEKRALKAAAKRLAAGRVPINKLKMRPDYSFREANWQIGRAAERAGITVKLFNRKDRFLAWRKRNAKKARNAEKRAIGRQKKGMRGTRNS